jgi:hypothetical protein
MRYSIDVRALALLAGMAGGAAAAFGGDNEPPPGPYVFVFGSEAVMGGAVIHTGGPLRVYGRGFCGRATCPPALLRAGSERHQETVSVKEDGTFEAVISSADPLGSYVLQATQEVDGQTVLAAAPFTIVPRDEAEGQEPKEK